MKLDLVNIMNLVGVAMTVAQKFKTPGKDRETAVIESVQELLPSAEAASGIDFVNDEELNQLLADYIKARKALASGIAHAKNLKPQAPEGVVLPQ